MKKLLCLVLCLLPSTVFADSVCTLIWQAPQQHLAGNPPPSPVNVTGPLNYQLSISCPLGVNPPTQYQIWGGCQDSGAKIPAGYNNFYMNPNGTCNASPLANTSAGPNGGVPVNAVVSAGFVSFNFDLTKYFPASSIEDINVTSLYDPATGTYDAATPRTCPPNNDCDIAVTIGAPGSTATPTPTATPPPTSSCALSITSPVGNASPNFTISLNESNCGGNYNRAEFNDPFGVYHVDFQGTSLPQTDMPGGNYQVHVTAWSDGSYLDQIGQSNSVQFSVAQPVIWIR
jgi:hypothetical protein